MWSLYISPLFCIYAAPCFRRQVLRNLNILILLCSLQRDNRGCMYLSSLVNHCHHSALLLAYIGQKSCTCPLFFYTYGYRISKKLLSSCFPTMMMDSCMHSSDRHPAGSHTSILSLVNAEFLALASPG